jgi:uncharacterized membrane protein
MDTTYINLPPHIEETVRNIADLQEEHDSEATVFQRIITRITHFFGSQHFFATLTIVVALWISTNLAAASFHHTPLDRPPFILLQGAVDLSMLYMSILIFGTQQQDEKAAAHRERMTLQLVMINEQKSAKIIQLLEDLRHDSPFVRNRVDVKANAMAAPVNPQVVSKAIKEITLHKGSFK